MAPRDAAASSASWSISSSTGWTVRTTNGRVTNATAMKTAVRVFSMPSPSTPSEP